MISKKILTFLIGAMMFCGAYADINLSETSFQGALSTVPSAKQSAVTGLVTTSLPSVSVTEMMDIADAGFKDGENRLKDATAFVDAVLTAQQQYLIAVAECAKIKGSYINGKCVGPDGYELIYKHVCPSGQYCVTDFTDVVTNMKYVHANYINGYATAHNLKLTCLDAFRNGGTKHYLQCSALGQPYEFEFARLDASDAEIAAANKTTEEDEDGNATTGTACPATGNGLKSINDTTKVGDACSSSYITKGTVFMRKNNTCSCRAEACIAGYVVKSGKCVQVGNDNADVNNPEQAKTNIDMAMAIANTKLYDVCHDDKGITGGIEHCIEDPFNWVQVQLLAANELIKQYVRLHYNNKEVFCDTGYETVKTYGNDDYVKCATTDGKDFFTFKFHDIRESFDSTNSGGVKLGICKVYDLEDKGIGENRWCQRVSESKYADITKFAEKFALRAECKNGNCNFFEMTSMYDGDRNDQLANVATIPNVDPCAFYVKSIVQINSSSSLTHQIETYVRSNANINKFSCNAKATQVNSDKTAAYCGKKDSDGMGYVDDILRCYADDKPIDFIFDDTTELMKFRDRGGKQAISCVASGGKFTGDDCVLAGEAQCNQIKKLSAQTCPECKSVVWDAADQICKLPSSASLRKFQDGIEVTAKVGMAAGVVVLTAVSGGSALAIAGAGVALAGTITIETTGYVQDESMRDFIQQLNACNAPACARTLLTPENIKAMQNTKKTADNELLVDAMDALLARLWSNADPETINKLADMCEVDAEGYLRETDTCPFYPSKVTGYQIAKAVGTTLEIAGGLMMIAGSFDKVTRTVTQQVESLKTTGWIKTSGGWLNQTTGETLAKLPRGVAGWSPAAKRWMAYGVSNNWSTFGFKSMPEVANIMNISETTTVNLKNAVTLGAGVATVGNAAGNAGSDKNQPWVPTVNAQ